MEFRNAGIITVLEKDSQKKRISFKLDLLFSLKKIFGLLKERKKQTFLYFISRMG